MSELSHAIRNFIESNYLPPGSKETFGDDDDLFDAGVIDSAALLSLIAWAEQTFELSIPDEDLLPQNFSTITATAAYLSTRTGQR